MLQKIMSEHRFKSHPAGIRKDVTGRRFGRLTAEYPERVNGKPRWRCRCACGKEITVRVAVLLNGHTQSCGCYKNDLAGGRTRTHGLSGTPLYRVWNQMRQRCNNPNDPKFADYGGRGIRVCDRWEKSFEDFAADMGSRPSDGHSIDRRNNDGNYEPSNCRWATATEQSRNRRPFKRVIAAAVAVVASACSTPTVTKVETQQVLVPVATQPIAPSQVPAPPPPLPKRPDSLSAAADTLLAQVCALEGYVIRADPLLRLSAGETPGTPPNYPECDVDK